MKRIKHQNSRTKRERGEKIAYRIFNNRIFFVSLLVLAFIAVIINIPFSELQAGLNSPKKSSVLAATTKINDSSLSATPSASASATPTPNIKPVATRPFTSGKQVHVPILMYHYIGNNPNPKTDPQRDSLSVPPDKFEAQMKYLSQNGYNTISLD